jgi:C4-dicarboxylate-specific signal transduction histidine kinase
MQRDASKTKAQLAHEIEELRAVNAELERRVHERTAEPANTKQQVTFETMNASRMSVLGMMASNIAHEINNPLAVIYAGARQLENIVGDPALIAEQMGKITGAITRNVDRIQRIVRALRSLSREGSSDPFVKASIKSIVADVLELCQTRFRIHDISLLISDDCPDVEAECRASQLSQVLLNLLNNSYSAIEKLPEKWVRLDIRDEGDTVMFSVTDSGHGLSAAACEKIFIPFYTTKKEGKGVGLGLSISKAIIEDHNGEIEIDRNSPNTRFVVRIPKRQDSSHGKAALSETP